LFCAIQKRLGRIFVLCSQLKAILPVAKGKIVSKNSPADQQILDVLARLQASLGDDFTKLETDEIDAVRAILKHGETLVKIAKYEEAKGLFWAHWRSLILGAGAVLSVLLLFWNNTEKLLRSIGKALQ
jgi:hypothetical protein